MKQTNTTCLMPYYSTAHITVEGKYKICCYQDEKYTLNFTSKDIFQNGYVRDVRKDMEEGKKHLACEGCYSLEDNGIKSPRQLFNERFSERFKKQKPDVIRRMNIRFSNVCNLACRMCNSFSSTGRIAVDKELGLPVSGNVLLPENVKKFLYDKKNISNLEHLDIKGGEPFLHSDHFLFLEYLIENDFSKKIHLFYNTNGTVLPGINGYNAVLPKGYKNIFDMFQKFRKVSLGLSLDAFGEKNDYIRIGSQWEKIIENIDHLQKYSYIDLQITSTIMIDNIWNFPKLLLFARSMNIPIMVSGGSYVTKPDYMDIRILPDDQKKKIELLYTQVVKKYSLSNIDANTLTSIIKFMNSKQGNTQLYEAYKKKNRTIDNFFHIQTHEEK